MHSADETSGAVLRGQEGNQVDNRVARCSYGVEYRSRCVESSSNAEWCPYEERWFRAKRMQWYITKVCTNAPAIYDLEISSGY